jgi:hypothetical protein
MDLDCISHNGINGVSTSHHVLDGLPNGMCVAGAAVVVLLL